MSLISSIPHRAPVGGPVRFAPTGTHADTIISFVSAYGSITSYPYSYQPIIHSPKQVTSTTGHSRRGYVKKQMSSTSRSYSYRRRYYPKKRKYRY